MFYVCFAGLLIWGFLPWLDKSKVKSIRYRGNLYRVSLVIFVISFFALMWLGMKPVTELYQNLARIFTVLYFSFFIFMPWLTKNDACKPVPDRVR